MAKIIENIYLRDDGRYEARYYDSTHKRCSVYGKTLEEVYYKLTTKLNSLPNESSVCSALFEEIVQNWLISIKSRVKESTFANYETKIENHLMPFFQNVKFTEITPTMVYDFINKKLENGLSAKYVADIVVLLKSIFRDMCEILEIHNPIAKVHSPLRKVNEKEIKLFTKSEQIILQKYIANNLNITTMGIALTYFTGIRLGELCGLKWSDIDLKNGTMTIRRTVQRIKKANANRKTQLIISDPKTQTSKRIIPLPEFIINMLKKFCKADNIFIISGKDKPIDPRTMQNRFKSVLKKIGLPDLNFHALRHMFATNSIELNCDTKTLSELLGHSDVEVTLCKYVHSSFEHKRTFMNQLRLVV